MRAFHDPVSTRHDPPGFVVSGRPQPSPERPERVGLLLEGLAQVGARVEVPAPVTLAACEGIHTRRYLTFLSTVVERWARLPGASDVPLPNIHALGRPGLPTPGYPASVVGQVGYHLGDGSSPITADTLPSALAAAGCALAAARAVISVERAAYALARPPGHHASADMAAGFCYLNNAALAAQAVVAAGGRPAILDIDVHHGNGTEAIFYDRADVLTVSLHCDPARFYPFFWGYADETGFGAGEGYNLNIPLPRGTQDDAYLDALDHALARVQAFRPSILVVALGLDTAAEDPFQAMGITRGGFERIGRAIRATGLPLVIVQEGGYPAPTLAGNLAAFLSAVAP